MSSLNAKDLRKACEILGRYFDKMGWDRGYMGPRCGPVEYLRGMMPDDIADGSIPDREVVNLIMEAGGWSA